MAYDRPDPYYQPEYFGLTQIAEISADLSYEFDMIVAWRHEDGTVFWGADSGCSCPSPFEDYHQLSDLNRLPETEAELERAVAEHASTDYEKFQFWKAVRG